MVIWAFAAVRSVLFIPTFSCSFRQLLESLHTSNTTREKKKNIFKETTVCSILSERKAGAGERSQMRGEVALSGRSGAFNQTKEEIWDEDGHLGDDSGLVIDLSSWGGEIPGGDRYCCMSAGPSGNMAATGLKGSRGVRHCSRWPFWKQHSTNKSLTASITEHLYGSDILSSTKGPCNNYKVGRRGQKRRGWCISVFTEGRVVWPDFYSPQTHISAFALNK